MTEILQVQAAIDDLDKYLGTSQVPTPPPRSCPPRRLISSQTRPARCHEAASAICAQLSDALLRLDEPVSIPEDIRSCQEAVLKYASTVCSLGLTLPLSSLDAAAIDTLSPPIGELALAVQLVCAAARMHPRAQPLLPLLSPQNAQFGTCPLASIGALFALCHAAASPPASLPMLNAQIASELSALAVALCDQPQQQAFNQARLPALLSECVSELLRRCGHWAPILEQTLHTRAVDAIHQLVTKVSHPHMSACTDAILPVICEICCHFDAAHRGTGARALAHALSHADKLILRLHKDRILKVCCALTPCAA